MVCTAPPPSTQSTTHHDNAPTACDGTTEKMAHFLQHTLRDMPRPSQPPKRRTETKPRSAPVLPPLPHPSTFELPPFSASPSRSRTPHATPARAPSRAQLARAKSQSGSEASARSVASLRSAASERDEGKRGRSPFRRGSLRRVSVALAGGFAGGESGSGGGGMSWRGWGGGGG